jgi:hypothetical protein
VKARSGGGAIALTLFINLKILQKHFGGYNMSRGFPWDESGNCVEYDYFTQNAGALGTGVTENIPSLSALGYRGNRSIPSLAALHVLRNYSHDKADGLLIFIFQLRIVYRNMAHGLPQYGSSNMALGLPQNPLGCHKFQYGPPTHVISCL